MRDSTAYPLSTSPWTGVIDLDDSFDEVALGGARAGLIHVLKIAPELNDAAHVVVRPGADVEQDPLKDVSFDLSLAQTIDRYTTFMDVSGSARPPRAQCD